MSWNVVEADGLVRLSGTLDINAVGELRDALVRHVAGDGALDLDLSGVAQCDTAALQLLLSARASAVALGRPLRILEPSAAVAQTCEALGLPLASLSFEPDEGGRGGSGA